jgi:hypothetical protein
MKRRRISEGAQIEVRMSSRERELLVDHTSADPEYGERLQATSGKPGYVGAYSLDDLEDMLGYIAAEANHCEDRKLQKELYEFFDRLSILQQSYDDGN